MNAPLNARDFTPAEQRHLERCVALAQQALDQGHQPFGSVLVDAQGHEIFADHNRDGSGDATAHPEFEIARWAAHNLTPEQRANSVVYTSGEHCPMCSAAHAWVGLGRIVYVSSKHQLMSWLQEWGEDLGPVAALPIQVVAPGVPVTGPVWPYWEQVRQLQQQAFKVNG